MKRKTPSRKPSLYLNLIWHQHQPLYVDPESDRLLAPWVRTHATKDYYSMPAILREYPTVHCSINLTPVLLLQLQEYYVTRLRDIGGVKARRQAEDPSKKESGPKTDLWTDLTLKDAALFTPSDRAVFTEGPWNAFSLTDVLMKRFPEYRILKSNWRMDHRLTETDLRSLKFWFLLANFHPMFFRKKVELIDGTTIDLRRILRPGPYGQYYTRKAIDESDCRRLVQDAWKVMKNIVPIHKHLMYRTGTVKGGRRYTGQIELTTTPFYHPILPLIIDSSVARACQPRSPLPKRFRFYEDAEWQIKLGLQLFKKLFGESPKGMWPAEGAVSHEMVEMLVRHNIRWIATDEKILSRSKPGGLSKYKPHAVDPGKAKGGKLCIFFRDTELSDKISFVYKGQDPKLATEDFIGTLLRHSPAPGEDDRIVTVALDGENAWEWYQYDPEGELFLRGIYRRLSELYRERKVITTTPSEYLEGNPERGIPPHPVHSLPVVESLWPGSWINANFDTWIGEKEKNAAWNFLRQARLMLQKSRLSPETLLGVPPRRDTRAWYARRAWEELFAAEGSDWFWWMGSEASRSGERGPMADLFLKHLTAVYKYAERAGVKVSKPDFSSLAIGTPRKATAVGTMRRGRTRIVTVRFQCDARGVEVPRAIYITGSHRLLGNWVPNRLRMYDDGTHGDKQPGDGIWTVEVGLPEDSEVYYKFTNSGQHGSWAIGDEMPGVNRRLRVTSSGGGVLELLDVFGRL